MIDGQPGMPPHPPIIMFVLSVLVVAHGAECSRNQAWSPGLFLFFLFFFVFVPPQSPPPKKKKMRSPSDLDLDSESSHFERHNFQTDGGLMNAQTQLKEEAHIWAYPKKAR